MTTSRTAKIAQARLLGGPFDGMALPKAPEGHFTARNKKPPYWATYVFIEVNETGEREYLCMSLNKEKPDG